MVDEEVTSPQITRLLEDLQKDWYLLKCYLLIHRRVPTTFGVAEVGPLGKADKTPPRDCHLERRATPEVETRRATASRSDLAVS